MDRLVEFARYPRYVAIWLGLAKVSTPMRPLEVETWGVPGATTARNIAVVGVIASGWAAGTVATGGLPASLAPGAGSMAPALALGLGALVTGVLVAATSSRRGWLWVFTGPLALFGVYALVGSATSGAANLLGDLWAFGISAGGLIAGIALATVVAWLGNLRNETPIAVPRAVVSRRRTLSLIKAIAGGRATTVVRRYPVAQGGQLLLDRDTAVLQDLGYEIGRAHV